MILALVALPVLPAAADEAQAPLAETIATLSAHEDRKGVFDGHMSGCVFHHRLHVHAEGGLLFHGAYEADLRRVRIDRTPATQVMIDMRVALLEENPEDPFVPKDITRPGTSVTVMAGAATLGFVAIAKDGLMRVQRDDRDKARDALKAGLGEPTEVDGTGAVRFPSADGSIFMRGDSAFDTLVALEDALLRYQTAYCQLAS